MRIRRRLRARNTRESSISQYGIGQRVVELVLWSDGHARWECNCERYRASVTAAQGPWCKHVAKAAAIRSIERLTGERVISRSAARSSRAVEAPAGIPLERPGTGSAVPETLASAVPSRA
jgi:hypothetical protein